MNRSFIIFLSSLFSLQVSAQTDKRLDSLKKSIPVKWLLTQNDSELVIRRKDTVWLMMDMRMNAPARTKETEEQYIQRIKKYGKKIIPYYVFRAEPLWSIEKRKEVLKQNREIEDAINKLPKKHNIERLRDNYLSAKGHDYYVPVTRSDSIAVNTCLAEKAKLEKSKTPFPDYNTSRLSLFKVMEYGHESELNALWPFEASKEMSLIDRKLREILSIE